jgi:hypothetical protein
VLLDLFRADPIEYLRVEIGRIPANTVGNNLDTNPHIQGVLNSSFSGARTVRDRLEDAGAAVTERECAEVLLSVLQRLGADLHGITNNECK